jgi:hypothetical protein
MIRVWLIGNLRKRMLTEEEVNALTSALDASGCEVAGRVRDLIDGGLKQETGEIGSDDRRP